jgi:hypothetical protein
MAIIDGEPQWTDDANKALRFARKEDADALKAWWCMTAISIEHIWPQCDACNISAGWNETESGGGQPIIEKCPECGYRA